MAVAKTIDHVHRGVPEIRDYGDAWAHWERQGNLKPRQNGDRMLGEERFTNRVMRLHDGDSISMRYYDEHMITYHPDDTISVSALSTQRNADPAERIFPFGVLWMIGTRTGSCVMTHPINEPDKKGSWAWWWLRRDKQRAPRCLVVRAHPDTPVRMHLVDDRWEPVDVEALEPFRWTAFDIGTARGASVKEGIPDFVSALDAYLAMNVPLPDYEKDVTDAQLLSRLRERDFAGVMAGLPRNTNWGPWQVGQPRVRLGDTVRPSAIAKLRTQAIVAAGATFVKEQKLLTLPEWVKVEGALKRFGQPK